MLPSGLCDVPASAFLRPYNVRRRQLEPLRRARLRSGLAHAARTGRIFHLWWHPYNFAHNRNENLSLLEHVLDDFVELSRTDGIESLTMSDVSDRVTQGQAAGAREIR
jgi:hypothetical protein